MASAAVPHVEQCLISRNAGAENQILDRPERAVGRNETGPDCVAGERRFAWCVGTPLWPTFGVSTALHVPRDISETGLGWRLSRSACDRWGVVVRTDVRLRHFSRIVVSLRSTHVGSQTLDLETHHQPEAEGDARLIPRCTTANVAIDKSNYWVPQLYRKYGNGSVIPAPLSYVNSYYQMRR